MRSAEDVAGTPKTRALSLRAIVNNAGIGLALFLMVVFFSIASEYFLSANNVTNILTQITTNSRST